MHTDLKILQKTLTAFAIIIIFFGFTEAVNPPPSNWYQQFMPNLNNQPISDIFFLDSLTGWAVTNDNTPQDTGYVLKTTNGGDNWTIKFQDKKDFGRIKFIDQNTGFTCGGTGSGTGYVYKSTNGGNSWFIVSVGNNFYNDMSVLNVDTIWLVDPDGLLGGVFYSSNGGASWTQQFSGGNQNPNKIYMYNARIGFMTHNNSGSQNIYKTTNSGGNWDIIVSGGSFNDIFFSDSLRGWSAYDSVRMTTNGGINWQSQVLPYGGYNGGFLNYSYIFQFASINRDTIFGVGGRIAYPNTQLRGLVYRTTNGGNNWLFQLPDTSINIAQYLHVNFINKSNGWAYSENGIHTTTGGDPVWLTGIQRISSQIPKDFKLFQNYPNPFNPKTNIKYQITENVRRQTSEVKLIVYDITGRIITTLVNQKQSSGAYQVDFNGSGFSSGVYFYQLITDGKVMDCKKMILLK